MLPPMPAANIAPRRRLPARSKASSSTLPTSAMFTRCVGTSLLRSASSAAVSRRSACSGDTRRSARSGRKANTRATHTPMPSPMPIARQSSDTLTSTGRKSLMATGSVYWMATPSAAPTAAPANPIMAACAT